MCQGGTNSAEIQIALEQLQALAEHVQQAIHQWHDHLEHTGSASSARHLQEAAGCALQLRRALQQAGRALSGDSNGGHPRPSVTAFTRPHRHFSRGIG